MGTQTSVMAEGAGFVSSNLLELWQLDGTAIGLQSIYYFCSMTNSNNFGPVVFNGISYFPLPIKSENYSYDGRGALIRPKITLSNIGGYISALLLQNQQLAGATLTRTRVYARFLDASNFISPTPSWVTPDPTASFPAEAFVINRKVAENPQVVQFELASPIDVQGVKLPRLQVMASVCGSKYRYGTTCGYDGPPVADQANRSFTGSIYNMTLNDRGAYSSVATYARGDWVFVYSSLPQFANIKLVYVCNKSVSGISPVGDTSGTWTPDSCSHSCAGCKLRFTGNTPLRILAFPGASRANWIG